RADGERNSDDERHHGDEDREREYRGDAEVVDVRLPFGGRQERQAGRSQRRQGQPEQEPTDEHHDRQHTEPCCPRAGPKEAVPDAAYGDQLSPSRLRSLWRVLRLWVWTGRRLENRAEGGAEGTGIGRRYQQRAVAEVTGADHRHR